MIKLIVFDLDGVLVDAKDIHYDALNYALESVGKEYVISKQEHFSTFDGLSTAKKLKILSQQKGLPTEYHSQICAKKQAKTVEYINKFTEDKRIQEVLSKLQRDGFIIACATNSIRETAKLQLLRKGFLEFIDFVLSNEDVKNPKPHSEIYLRCMIAAEVNPEETLIVEDSFIGRSGALKSKGHLLTVRDSNDVTYEKIKNTVDMYEQNTCSKWKDSELNVLVPMAGAGSRFEKAGYTFPKPLIDVKSKPMIQWVVDNLNIDAHYIFIVQKEHYTKYNLQNVLNSIAPNCDIIQVDGVTEGAACTTLLAKELINNDKSLLIANSDQFVEWNSSEFMYSMSGDNAVDGGILTFTSIHPKWSYVRLNEEGYVCEVAEKNPISNLATVGIYYWKKGKDYVRLAEQMIEKNVRVNNEFYVCPVFNEALLENKKIKTFNTQKMWGLGTPEDLNIFLKDYKG